MDVHGNLIAGNWEVGNDALDNINPSDTNDLVGRYTIASIPDTKTAIEAARAATSAWARSTTQLRSDILFMISTELFNRREELGELLAREEGKLRAEAIGEVARAAHVFRYFAGEAVRYGGEVLPSVRPGVSVAVTREPVGVIGIITPWNFPIAIPAWKIAPALAFGNTVVFKPSELTPGCGWALADIIQRAGIPAGVFNLVMG